MESNMGRPSSEEYAPFYSGYIARVNEENVLGLLQEQISILEKLAAKLNEEQALFRYQADKWSIKELFSHLTDAERVFGYRAFCISRADKSALPAFDENNYVANSGADKVALADLAREFALVRKGNLEFLKRLAQPAWNEIGTANGAPTSVRALTYIMAGHVEHHLEILRTRYGVQV